MLKVIGRGPLWYPKKLITKDLDGRIFSIRGKNFGLIKGGSQKEDIRIDFHNLGSLARIGTCGVHTRRGHPRRLIRKKLVEC